MLAPKNISDEFIAWNRKYKAPNGANWWDQFVNSKSWVGNFAWRNRLNLPYGLMRQIGAFGFQRNSPTRTFEYPWCFSVTPLAPSMPVVEVGAAASGFQFILAENGLNVTSVDPVVNPSGEVDWIFTDEKFNHLNTAFGGKVKFIRDFLQNAQLESNYYDRVFSISTIEHIPQEAVVPLMQEIKRILKPGGAFITTIDLFLDCYPFTDKVSNLYGSNISIRSLVEQSGLTLKVGNPSELYGYSEFDPDKISKRLDEFLVIQDAWEPSCLVLTQGLVLEKAP